MKNFLAQTTLFALMALHPLNSSLANEQDFKGLLKLDVSADASGSDINVGKLELMFDRQINKQVDIHLMLLHEEDAANNASAVFDESSIIFNTGNYQLTAGREVVPFGIFDTLVVSQPLTLQLVEAKESVVKIERNDHSLNYAGYIFSGESLAGKTTRIDGFGFSINGETDAAHWGVAYINHIGDSETLQELGGTVQSKVPGAAFAISTSLDEIRFVFEAITALGAFQVGDYAGKVKNSSKPMVYAIDLGFRQLGFSYQASEQADFSGLAASLLLVSWKQSLADGLQLGVELSSAKDYLNQTSESLLVQLSAEF